MAVVGRNGDSSVWEKVGSRSALLDHAHPTHMETLRVIGLRRNSNQPLVSLFIAMIIVCYIYWIQIEFLFFFFVTLSGKLIFNEYSYPH